MRDRVLNEVLTLSEVMGCALIQYDPVSLQEEESRTQIGTEGDQKGGWDRNASRGTGLLSCHPHSWSALLWLCALGSTAQVQVQLTVQLLWGTSSLGRVSRSLL